MKIYAVNSYVGGLPMDGETIGVFDTLKKAQECFDITLKSYEMSDGIIESTLNESLVYSVYWDNDAFWGGIKIVELTLNN